MNNLYEEAKGCFLETDPDAKLEQSLKIAGMWDSGLLEWQDGDPLLSEIPLHMHTYIMSPVSLYIYYIGFAYQTIK